MFHKSQMRFHILSTSPRLMASIPGQHGKPVPQCQTVLGISAAGDDQWGTDANQNSLRHQNSTQITTTSAAFTFRFSEGKMPFLPINLQHH